MLPILSSIAPLLTVALSPPYTKQANSAHLEPYPLILKALKIPCLDHKIRISNEASSICSHPSHQMLLQLITFDTVYLPTQSQHHCTAELQSSNIWSDYRLIYLNNKKPIPNDRKIVMRWTVETTRENLSTFSKPSFGFIIVYPPCL